MSSMVMTNKDIEDLEGQLEEIKNKTSNDLEKRIEDLERIESIHRRMNGELRKEVFDLKLKAAKADEYETTINQLKSFINDLTIENNRLSNNEKNTTELLKEFRNKGDI